MRTCPKCESTFCYLVAETGASISGVLWYIECGACHHQGKRVVTTLDHSGEDVTARITWEGLPDGA